MVLRKDHHIQLDRTHTRGTQPRMSMEVKIKPMLFSPKSVTRLKVAPTLKNRCLSPINNVYSLAKTRVHAVLFTQRRGLFPISTKIRYGLAVVPILVGAGGLKPFKGDFSSLKSCLPHLFYVHLWICFITSVFSLGNEKWEQYYLYNWIMARIIWGHFWKAPSSMGWYIAKCSINAIFLSPLYLSFSRMKRLSMEEIASLPKESKLIMPPILEITRNGTLSEYVMDWMFVSTPKFVCWKPNPNVMVFAGRTFGRQLGRESRAFTNGISVFLRSDQRAN